MHPPFTAIILVSLSVRALIEKSEELTPTTSSEKDIEINGRGIGGIGIENMINLTKADIKALPNSNAPPCRIYSPLWPLNATLINL